jgi:hypothetical protein
MCVQVPTQLILHLVLDKCQVGEYSLILYTFQDCNNCISANYIYSDKRFTSNQLQPSLCHDLVTWFTS